MIANLIAIDPGFKSSGLGIAFFEKELLLKTEYVRPKGWLDSVRDTIEHIERYKRSLEKYCGHVYPLEIVIETSYYKGKAAIYHLKFLGAMQYVYPALQFISPMTVKKYLGLSKTRKPEGMKNKDWEIEKKNLVAKELKKKLIGSEPLRLDFQNSDVVDAVAIGKTFIEKEKDNVESDSCN